MKIKKQEVHKSGSWKETVNFRTIIYLKASQIGNIIKSLEKKELIQIVLQILKKAS